MSEETSRYMSLAPLKVEGGSTSFDDPQIAIDGFIERYGIENVIEIIEDGLAYRHRKAVRARKRHVQ